MEEVKEKALEYQMTNPSWSAMECISRVQFDFGVTLSDEEVEEVCTYVSVNSLVF